MKKLLFILALVLSLPTAHAALSYPGSNQLAPSPTNGYCLTTDGTSSAWSSSCGGASLSGGSPNTLTYWTSGTAVGATSSPTVGYITATSTTATSTFNGGFTASANSNTFRVFSPSGTIAIQSAGYGIADVNIGNWLYLSNQQSTMNYAATEGPTIQAGNGVGGLSYRMMWMGIRNDSTYETGILATSSNSTSTERWLTLRANNKEVARADYTGNFGIGTTSPWRNLSVYGSSDLGSNALAGTFTATSTTGTSTFAGAVSFATTTVLGPTMYNTSDTSSTWERFQMFWSGNVMNLKVQDATSGQAHRNLSIGTKSRAFLFDDSAAGGTFYNFTNSTSLSNAIMGITTTHSNSSGNNAELLINPTLNQSGTAGYTGIQIKATENTLGSATNYFIEAGTSTNLNLFTVNNSGVTTADSFNASNTAATSTFAGAISSTGSSAGLLTMYNGSTLNVNLTGSGTSWFNGGNVGIGTSSPVDIFSVQGSSAGSATKGTCFRAKDVGAASAYTYWWYKAGVQTIQTGSCSGSGTTTITFD